VRILAPTILALGLIAAPVGARGETIWSALIFGTNSDEPKAIPRTVEPYAPMLKRIFGYNQFEVVGQHRESIKDDEAGWLLPSKHFFLRVDSKRIDEGIHRLNLALYQDKRLLVDTTAKLGAGSPLLIRGPLYGKGQLIILLLVQ
jgi:hypothetical protein